MTSSSAYLRFLNLTHAVNDQLGNADVDLLALRLLEAIAIADAKGTHLTVTEAMSLREIASPATMHRKLNTLLDAGLILQTYEGKNRRTKYLVPTASAAKHFEQLGKAMLSALHTN
jgi:DNA-binding MarR family transcriptional regulator